MSETNVYQQAVDEELRSCLMQNEDKNLNSYFDIFAYQFGWSEADHLSKGKRVRPLLVLLSAQAVGGDWQKALPAAAAIEMMHNFSLIHDDIQDKSLLRRGKETVWVKWGEALAINAGDALLAYSLQAPQRLLPSFPAEAVVQVQTWLSAACVELTQGQFLDMQFESTETVSLELYFKMIGGKTCALLQTALKLGALLGGAEAQQIGQFEKTGLLLGQAFQVQDDWLGIWGNDQLTGKSNDSDLIARKKSFPILAGLAKRGEFYRLWADMPLITASHVPALVRALEKEGVKEETERQMALLYQQTFASFSAVGCSSDSAEPLEALMQGLIARKM